MAAMREIWLSLAPHGMLLLGLPTCHRDVLFFPCATLRPVSTAWQPLMRCALLSSETELAFVARFVFTRLRARSWHRVYGPSRLERMLRGFDLLARVWDGVVVRGGLEAAHLRPSLFPEGSCWWQHQQVLMLRRQQEWPDS